MSYKFLVTGLWVIVVASVLGGCAPGKRAAAEHSSADKTAPAAAPVAPKATDSSGRPIVQESIPAGSKTQAVISGVGSIINVHSKSWKNNGLMLVIEDSNKKHMNVTIENSAVDAGTTDKAATGKEVKNIVTNAESASYECQVQGQSVKECESMIIKVTTKTGADLTINRILTKNRLVLRQFQGQVTPFGSAVLETNDVVLNENIATDATKNGQTKSFSSVFIIGDPKNTEGLDIKKSSQGPTLLVNSRINNLEAVTEANVAIKYEEKDAPVFEQANKALVITLVATAGADKQDMMFIVELTKEAQAKAAIAAPPAQNGDGNAAVVEPVVVEPAKSAITPPAAPASAPATAAPAAVEVPASGAAVTVPTVSAVGTQGKTYFDDKTVEAIMKDSQHSSLFGGQLFGTPPKDEMGFKIPNKKPF